MRLVKRLTLAVLLATPAWAQAPPQQVDIPTVTSQLAAVGCQAERGAAASTIVNLQKQIDDLKKQLNAKDPPPKSGATKH